MSNNAAVESLNRDITDTPSNGSLKRTLESIDSNLKDLLELARLASNEQDSCGKYYRDMVVREIHVDGLVVTLPHPRTKRAQLMMALLDFDKEYLYRAGDIVTRARSMFPGFSIQTSSVYITLNVLLNNNVVRKCLKNKKVVYWGMVPAVEEYLKSDRAAEYVKLFNQFAEG